ncbi:hypothetical protein MAR_000194 [Mya arenaria]|uniref:Uncharacterized protein n=1 Tax=Mya arenaria TaxID=6604 RepID=A0ABY7FGJ6_MYAAR|nr:hypothetical protein MAR_000194 [Mya arenaria]
MLKPPCKFCSCIGEHNIDWQSRAWGMYEVACEAEVDEIEGIETQVVVDGNDKINDIVARWPGSVHLYRILRGSGLSQLLDNGPGSPDSSIYLVIAAILI